MKRDEHRHLDSGPQTRWLRYASAGSVALASAGAYGEIILIPTTKLSAVPGTPKVELVVDHRPKRA